MQAVFVVGSTRTDKCDNQVALLESKADSVHGDAKMKQHGLAW